MKALDDSVSSVYRMDMKVIMPNSLGDQLFNWAVGIYAIAKKTNIQLEALETHQERVFKNGYQNMGVVGLARKTFIVRENASQNQRLDRLMLRSGRFPALSRGAIESKS